MIQFRAGRKFYSIPGLGFRAFMPAAGAISWWISGGIPAANCIGAWQAKGAASQAASYVNLANPGTYDLTLGDAPAWDTALGWTFNGSSDYLKTGIIPTGSYSMICRFANWNQTTLGYYMASQGQTNTRFYLGVNTSAAGNVVYGLGQTLNVAPRITSGVMAVSNVSGYRNGVSDTASLGSFSGTGAQVYIGCRNQNGVATNFSATDIIAAAIYDIAIDSYQSALYTAIAAL